jgi:hypothetical protein
MSDRRPPGYVAHFRHPEYASYVALCRDLKLKPGRPPESGDEHEFSQAQAPVWLPRLDDWLAIFLAAGWGGFSLWRRPPAGWTGQPLPPPTMGWACRPINAGAIEYDLDPPDAPTPEEACARLWLALQAPVPR